MVDYSDRKWDRLAAPQEDSTTVTRRRTRKASKNGFQCRSLLSPCGHRAREPCSEAADPEEDVCVHAYMLACTYICISHDKHDMLDATVEATHKKPQGTNIL